MNENDQMKNLDEQTEFNNIYPEANKVSYGKDNTPEEVKRRAEEKSIKHPPEVEIKFRYDFWMRIGVLALFLNFLMNYVLDLFSMFFVFVDVIIPSFMIFEPIGRRALMWIILILPFIVLIRALLAHREITTNNITNKSVMDKVIQVGLVSSIASVISILAIGGLIA
ncbi:MAG: hypothetical protein KIG14_01200 [Candidatus Sacchiramonaceae bacterium]|nr:hypothetical protein [Candidatus Saccharimonadaceae bacterium]